MPVAGAIAVFISQGAVIRLLGADANKVVAYGIASISGTIFAVCSCTVLPLFGGLYKRGAGLGPAIAFLYSGPAINILAIVLTAKVLGFELAGPALSLPSMLVIHGFLGTQKTVIYVSLVVVMATITGMIFGTYWG